MAKELSGYGPTAGESMGGTGANLNQQGGNNNSNSGVHWGGGSGHGNNGGQGNSNSSGSTSTVMKTGESYLTPWGDVVINNDGLPVMNGIVMTEDNSTLVDNPFGGVSRVLNSLISDMPSLFAESSGNNNNNTASVNTAPTNAQVSDMDKSSKVVGNVINEKQKQKNKIATQISEKQKKIEEMKKVFGFAPIFPDTCYHLTHYWPAAADIPVASDNPVHYADAIRYNARTPLQGSLLPLTRLV